MDQNRRGIQKIINKDWPGPFGSGLFLCPFLDKSPLRFDPVRVLSFDTAAQACAGVPCAPVCPPTGSGRPGAAPVLERFSTGLDGHTERLLLDGDLTPDAFLYIRSRI